MTRPGKSRRQRGKGSWKHQKGRPSQEPQEKALVIFAKAPVAGDVKTRLCPPLTPDEAASLHGTLVMDMVERMQSLKEFDRILAGSPSADHPFFLALGARNRIKIWQQVGEDLGARMAEAFHRALEAAYRHTIIIGTDIPGITSNLIKQASEALENHDVVLGPTMDGGYYLIGLRKEWPELFTEMPWSTSTVFAQTEKRIEALGGTVKFLPELRDLDTKTDLDSFIQESNNPQRAMFSTRTRNVLKELANRLRERSGEDHS